MLPHELSPTENHSARAQANAIYEAIKGDLASRYKGQIVAIEVESGEHFVGKTVLEAATAARVKHPHKQFQFFRLGSSTVYVWR
ncbi:MAG: hypothetical protein HOP18_05545 [Deltaproteobacteria bacterium]|nr:hypothetical protein [Deltaproteobacteria bacterium]